MQPTNRIDEEIDRRHKPKVHGIDPSVLLMQLKKCIAELKEFAAKLTVHLAKLKDSAMQQTVYPTDRMVAAPNRSVVAIDRSKSAAVDHLDYSKSFR